MTILKRTRLATGTTEDIPETDPLFMSELKFLRYLIGQPNIVALCRREAGLETLGTRYQLVDVE